MAWRKIIVGFKGDDRSRDALRFGAMVARDAGADLIVANAYGGTRSFRPGEEQRMTLRAEAIGRLSEAAALLPYASRAELRAIEDRSAVHALHVLAEDEKADLLVVGSTTKGTVELHAVGGVPERLLHDAPCPVAVAPDGFRYERDPGLHVIAAAVDGSPESRHAAEVAAELALAGSAGFKLIGIVEPSPPPMAGMSSVYLPDEGSYRDHMLRELQELADSLPSQLRTEIVLVDGEPVAELLERAIPLSLLVMGSRCHGPVRRALLGSISARVVRAAPCPVLVVPRRHEIAAAAVAAG